MMLWENINYNYAEAAMGYAFRSYYASHKGEGGLCLILFHTWKAMMKRDLCIKRSHSSSVTNDYNTKHPRIALQRMALDALFFLTVPGPKMIWQFGELGYDISINENGRTGEKPIKWDYYSDDDRTKLFLTYRFLLSLRKEYPVFRTSDFTWSLVGQTKSIQLINPTMKVDILGNFGVTPAEIIRHFRRQGNGMNISPVIRLQSLVQPA